MLSKTFAARSRRSLAALALIAIAGCGGGDFAEQFVKLITARFVPDPVTVAAGSHITVDLEVTCDRQALDTLFGRLGIRIKLDPNHRLPAAVTATLPGPPGADGFYVTPCSSPAADPDLRIAHVPVVVSVAAGTAALSATLEAYIEVEPLDAGEPSKDSTSAQLALTIGGGAAPVPGPGDLGGNLLINGVFDDSVGRGGDLPIAPGNWRGDPSLVVGAEQDIAPRGGPTMLRFDASGDLEGASSCRQREVVNLAPFQAAIAAGTVSARLAAFFNRIAGEDVGSRFDVRILAYDGSVTELPARYAAGTHLAAQTTTLQSVPYQWQEAVVTLVLPATTTYVLVEIEAHGGVSDSRQFAGNYADDASLTLLSAVTPGPNP